MKIRRLTIERFRGYDSFVWCPGDWNLILGPNGAGKSTILEAMDWLFDPGWGRPRPIPRPEDYWRRDVKQGFRIEVVLGDLREGDLADYDEALEGWVAGSGSLVPEPEGEGVESAVRVELRGTAECDLEYRLGKPELADVSFNPRLRRRVNFVFDGRNRDPIRQLAFYQGSLLEKAFSDVDLTAPLRVLADHLGDGERTVNADAGVSSVLAQIRENLLRVGIGNREPREPTLSVGGLSDRELLQALNLALRHDEHLTIPVARQGRGLQRLVLASFLLVLARRADNLPIGAFEEPEEALEPFRIRLLIDRLYEVVRAGGQVFVTSHSPEVLRCFRPDEVVLLNHAGSARRLCELRKELNETTRFFIERHMDGPVASALFAPVALLVDGPSERAALPTFWSHLSDKGEVPEAEVLGVQIVNCESTKSMPGIAQVLSATGQRVFALMDRDSDKALENDRSRVKQYASGGWVLHSSKAIDLEGVFALELPLDALGKGLSSVALDRGISWEEWREAIVSRFPNGTPAEEREAAVGSANWDKLTQSVNEERLREAIRSALKRGILDGKGGRPGRLIAQAAVEVGIIPQSLSRCIQAIAEAIEKGLTVALDLDAGPVK